jgi:hypothetical protein
MSTLLLASLSVHRDPRHQALFEARQLIADAKPSVTAPASSPP